MSDISAILDSMSIGGRLSLISRVLFALAVPLGGLSGTASAQQVVINEIHYNPDVKTEQVEFIELYNAGPEDVDLTGWTFRNGITYGFPADTLMRAHRYLLLAGDPASVMTKWSTQRGGVPTETTLGPFFGKLNNEGEEIELYDPRGARIDRVDYRLGFPWPTVGDTVPNDGNQAGSGHSIQLIRPDLDNDLGGSWRSALPTPGRRNERVYSGNVPPHIRQVQHRPQQPKSGQAAVVSAKVTDPDGVSSVLLLYQIVDPGNYIRVTDDEYNRDWMEARMFDNGLLDDDTAGDNVYSVTLPATLQTHRRLIRYRITCTDNNADSCTVPYPDDPQPNFAYFVYDGVPAWRAAIKPGDPGPSGQVVQYGTDVMRSLPVYHLIAWESDVLNCQYNSAYRDSDYDFVGTWVHEGHVYDHMRYRIRGQNSTYVTGKNKWKLRFNRGHFFQARDDYGKKYETKIKTLNLSALSSPWGPQNRGMAGMDEALAFRLFNMVGVPAYNTNWFQFRIIDRPQEADPDNQYDGDLWGLYMGFENPNSRFLDEHGLPDGNVYKMQGSHRYLNQGPTQPTDKSDLYRFTSSSTGYNKSNPIQPLSWWEQHVNLEAYYSYRSVVEVVNHGDIREQENSVYYHHPETDRWWMLPWDLDLLYEEFQRWGPQGIQSSSRLEQFRKVLQHPQALIAFQNRARELQDLLLNQDQLWQIIDELAATVADPNLPYSMADVDRAMWDYHPRTRSRFGSGSGAFYRTPFPGEDIYSGFYNYERVLPSADFAGMIHYIKDFVVPPGYGGTLLNDLLPDPDVPMHPTVTYIGAAEYPTNSLLFVTNALVDPHGNDTVAALQWRIAEIEPHSRLVPPTESPSGPASGNETMLLAAESPHWTYRTGVAGEPSTPTTAWRSPAFDDHSWLTGKTSIGYGDNDDNTLLEDMGGNYSTVYLRHSFAITDINEIGTLTLDVYVDDGCVVWINDAEIARVNVSAGIKAHSDLSEGPIVGNAAWQRIPLAGPYDYLREGANVLAVQAINGSLASSDLSIDVSLCSSQEANPTSPSETWIYPITRGKRGIYEIDAVWESYTVSDPLTDSVLIPASVVQAGHTYRVRCRMQDITNRWSHWSEPVQFMAGPALTQGLVGNLCITELMYNPAPAGDHTNNDDYEFIELKNISDDAVDLTHVSFTDGVLFDFNDSPVATLGPSQCVLIVADRAAFETRYGSDLSPIIAGQYEGKLANSGEHLKLIDYWDGTLVEFDYHDNLDWPTLADGHGYSLVPLESALPNQHKGSLNHATNWRISTNIYGSPGHDDP